MQCYFHNHPWDKVETCVARFRETGDRQKNDPFHFDPFLEADNEEGLNTTAFKSTRHDRGHLAPNNAFSWNLCATYHTFSMANMSPQRDHFNRTPWNKLEAQVLFWGSEHGPIYVTTGTVFNKFPVSRFKIYANGTMDSSKIYAKGKSLKSLNPGGNNPEVIIPTGYYKVIYRPAMGGETARAIGFLLPHTSENFKNYWAFASRIDLIEEVSGLRFHAIDSNLKKIWKSNFFSDRLKGGWGLRQNCNHSYTAGGWIENSTHDQRIQACALQ